MRLISRSPDETEAIGLKIGRLLKAGMIIKLYGDLGAGKTTMVRGIAASLGIKKEDVISPSFTIITEYESSPRFFHIDLYRISEGEDMQDLGFWDCIGNDTIAVIEWPEHAGNMLPTDAVTIKIEHSGEQQRQIDIEGIDEEYWHNL